MSAAKTSRWSALRQPLILAAVYFVATKLAVALTEMNSNAAAVWLPAGIGFAALVLHGLRLWPAVAIGAFLGVIMPATGWQAATLMMLANTLFAVAAVWLATQWLDFRAGMHRVRDRLRATARWSARNPRRMTGAVRRRCRGRTGP